MKSACPWLAGDLELTSPLISPLFANLEGLPPLLIHVGTHEILLDDATRLAENARQAGVDVTLETWDGMFHLFQIIPFVPETQQSIAQIAGFVTNKLKLSGENQGVASNSRF